MFSSRFHWDSRPNRLTELLAKKRRAGGPPFFDLTESNPTQAGLDYPSRHASCVWLIRVVLRYDPVLCRHRGRLVPRFPE